MTNNDILRRLRYTFELSDTKMAEIFAHANYTATRAEISDWLRKEEDEGFAVIDDLHLCIFLDGFISDKRGKKEGEQPAPEPQLSNNSIFRKLKIALNQKDEDILAILESVDMRISKHELSAFFRKPGQKQYRQCKDQILRNFLHGLQLKYRGKSSDVEDAPKEIS
ncbi:MAG: hypothetical protein K0S33_2720 [Bacteroidetes bacterium]|jgi:uncharacterized protein YehS (DUF1456 family)|nr:hypothetical protein [Bacteroidota bacterium]